MKIQVYNLSLSGDDYDYRLKTGDRVVCALFVRGVLGGKTPREIQIETSETYRRNWHKAELVRGLSGTKIDNVWTDTHWAVIEALQDAPNKRLYFRIKSADHE